MIHHTTLIGREVTGRTTTNHESINTKESLQLLETKRTTSEIMQKIKSVEDTYKE